MAFSVVMVFYVTFSMLLRREFMEPDPVCADIKAYIHRDISVKYMR